MKGLTTQGKAARVKSSWGCTRSTRSVRLQHGHRRQKGRGALRRDHHPVVRGEQWFDQRFLGEKAEALDFEVTLLGSSVFQANFFVQVKATAKAKRYAGTGMGRKLLVRLTAADAKKLGNMKVPAYVVGID